MGETEWNRLSTREKRTRLTELKHQERQLRTKGKYEDAMKLLGPYSAKDKGKKLKNCSGLQKMYIDTSLDTLPYE